MSTVVDRPFCFCVVHELGDDPLKKNAFAENRLILCTGYGGMEKQAK